MYQILAGVVIVVCFLLGMNSRSISGVKEETKIPPDPGKGGAENSAALPAETAKSREQIRLQLAQLASADNEVKEGPPSATCYKVSPPDQPVQPPPQPQATCYATPRPRPEPEPVPPPAEPPVIIVTPRPVQPPDAKTASREQIRGELKKLAASTPPDAKSLIMHAKCYKMVMPAQQAEYFCEKCKTKTLFSNTDAAVLRRVERVDFFRRQVADISKKKLNIYLDESGLCSKCSNGKPTGDVFAEISYPDENKPVRSKVELFDLTLILAFLDGKDRVSVNGPDCEPIKDHMKRLGELFGIEAGK